MSAPSERAVLLVNLGSPDSPDRAAVRRYLEQFLMDPRVVDLPWPLRRLLVSAVILPRRPPETSEAYHSIWMPEGAPLKLATDALAQALAERLDMRVAWAMRYGRPSIEERLVDLAGDGIRRVEFFALYPHWAMSTVETSLVEARRVIDAHGLDLELEPLAPFYGDAGYIEELARLAEEHLHADDHLLFSYHGLPERHITRCDPTGGHCLKRADCCETPSPAHATCYRHQVYETSRLVAERLGLPAGRWEVSFQSRLGRAQWLQPYTDETLAELPARGIRRLAVMCPAFVADNLETLEEIGIQGRETFLGAGGERFTLIPCLNARPGWVEVLASWLDAAPPAPKRLEAVARS